MQRKFWYRLRKNHCRRTNTNTILEILSPYPKSFRSYLGTEPRLTDSILTPFGPRVPLSDIGDAIHISEEDHRELIILNISSLTGRGLDRFLDSIDKTPIIEQ